MSVPKKYFHDRLILLLLGVNAFVALLGSILILLRLNPGRSASYIIQYRSNLGLDAFRSGSATAIVSFIIFLLLVLAFHTFLSLKVYHIRRHFSIAILGLGLLLLTLAFIVSNALLFL